MPDGNQQGQIKKTGLGKSAAPTSFDYTPETGSKTSTTQKHIKTKFKAKLPRDIPNSGINERSRYLKKHGKFKFKDKTVTETKTSKFTDVDKSKKKYKGIFDKELSSLSGMGAGDEQTIKSSAAKRRQAALSKYGSEYQGIQKMKEPGERRLREDYANRGMANSGGYQGAMENYNKTYANKFSDLDKNRDATIRDIASGEAAGLGKITASRNAARQGASAKYQAALKRLGK